MSWEQRGCQLYYYRKKREGNHVQSIYLGNSASAILCSELDQRNRESLINNQAQLRKQRLDVAIVDAELADFTRIVDKLMKATLLVSGFHPHKGQWRRKRHV